MATRTEQVTVREAVRKVMEKDSGRGEQLRSLLQASDTKRSDFDAFCVKLVGTVRSSMLKRGGKSVSRTKVLRSFHQLRLKELPELWEGLYRKVCLPVGPACLLQSVNRQLFDTLMVECCTQISEPSMKAVNPTVSLGSEEENAIRYASGYVAMKLVKRYKKEGSKKAAQFVECLSNMAVNGDDSSFYAYTKEWVNTVDRGGLFPINESTFLFFREVECKTQQCLPAHLVGCSQSASKDLNQQIFDDVDIQFYWSMLTADIEEEQYALELLHAIIQLWITIRGFAMTSSWMESYKQVHKKTTKCSNGLRRRLKESNTE